MGATEILLIFALVIVIFKPEKLADYLVTSKKVLDTVRDTSSTIKNDVNETISAIETKTQTTLDNAMAQAQTQAGEIK